MIPGLGRSSGEGNGCPLQYSGLENSKDCIIHGVAKSQTGLIDLHFYSQVCVYRKKHSIQRFLSFNPGTHCRGIETYSPQTRGDYCIQLFNTFFKRENVFSVYPHISHFHCFHFYVYSKFPSGTILLQPEEPDLTFLSEQVCGDKFL